MFKNAVFLKTSPILSFAPLDLRSWCRPGVLNLSNRQCGACSGLNICNLSAQTNLVPGSLFTGAFH